MEFSILGGGRGGQYICEEYHLTSRHYSKMLLLTFYFEIIIKKYALSVPNYF